MLQNSSALLENRHGETISLGCYTAPGFPDVFIGHHLLAKFAQEASSVRLEEDVHGKLSAGWHLFLYHMKSVQGELSGSSAEPAIDCVTQSLLD